LEKKIAEKFESRIDQINLSHREEIKALKKDLAYFEDQHAKTTLSKNNIQENIQVNIAEVDMDAFLLDFRQFLVGFS